MTGIRLFAITALAALFTLFTLAAGGTETVTIAVSGTTGTSTITGQLVAGHACAIVFERTDSAWSSQAVFRLTIKPDGRYDDTPFVLVSGSAFDVAGSTLTVAIDLNVAAIYTYLGKADTRMVMLELSDSTSAHVIRHRTPVLNSVSRPDDTAPANADANTYTDAEVDALIGAIPAGLSPIASPIDGWTVESTAAGQLRIGTIPAVHVAQVIDNYPETTTLATGDYILLYDASESALRKVSLNTLLAWLQAQLGL